MTGARSLAVVCVFAACVLGAGEAGAYGRGYRGPTAELLFGGGVLSSDTARLDAFDSVEAQDGTTFDVRFQLHFDRNVGLQIEGLGEAERTKFNQAGFTDSDDTSTRFFFVNALFDLSEGPVRPFVAAGVGRYHHSADFLIPDINGFLFLEHINENGPAYDVMVGVNGHSRGPLAWALDARYLHYRFGDFDEAWNRYLFEGHLGFRF